MDDLLTEDLPFKVVRRTWQPVAISRELKTGQVISFMLLGPAAKFKFIGPSAEDQLAFAIKVLDEDRFMCENQVPEEVPLSPTRGMGSTGNPRGFISEYISKKFSSVFIKKYLI